MVVRRRFLAGVLVSSWLLVSCGGEGDPTDSTASGGETKATGSLTFTRADGTQFSAEGGIVRCGPTSTEKKRPAIFVRTEKPSRSRPFFQLEAVLADVAADPVVELPNNFIESDPQGAVLYAYDPETKNELDSTFEDSSGAIRIESVSCEPRPEIAFSVKGTLDSEFGNLDPNRVQGSFRSAGG